VPVGSGNLGLKPGHSGAPAIMPAQAHRARHHHRALRQGCARRLDSV